jgi:hypothetical protein
LTHANKKDYASDKGIKSIPQTIVDAIEITRMLGIQYLWVDTFCIVQGDDNEFHVEGVKMMDYYKNSFVTISTAASTSAYDGIFLPCDPPCFSFETVYTNPHGVTRRMTILCHSICKKIQIDPNIDF